MGNEPILNISASFGRPPAGVICMPVTMGLYFQFRMLQNLPQAALGGQRKCSSTINSIRVALNYW